MGFELSLERLARLSKYVDVKLSSARSVDCQGDIVQSLLKHMSTKRDVVEEEETNDDETLEPLRNLEWSSSASLGEIKRTAFTKTVEPLDYTLSGHSGGHKLETDGV